ncbi:MAG: prepilin peptidase [Bacillota bacterium]
MLILLFALAGAICSVPIRLLTRQLVAARGGRPDESRLLSGVLSAALFTALGALGFALLSAVIPMTDIVRLIQFLLVFLILLSLSAVDIVVRRIPNELLLALILVYALGHTLNVGWSGITTNLLGAAIAAILFTLPARLGLQIGWGDIKYAVVIGFCFGLAGLLQVTLVMGLGLGLYAAYLYISRRGGLFTSAAIGPYLSLGAVATMVFPVFTTIF